MFSLRWIYTPWFWIVAGILSLLLYHLPLITAKVVYDWYFKNLFQLLRVLYDYSLGWSPIPAMYVAVLIVCYIIIRRLRKKTPDPKMGTRLKRIFIIIPAVAGMIIFSFYLLWGFNYKRDSLFTELNITLEKPDSEYLFSETDQVTRLLNSIRYSMNRDTNPLSNAVSFFKIESEIRIRQEKILKHWNVPVWGRVRVRKLHPEGIILRWSAAGIYIPFFMEGHIDGGLHPLQWPFVAAHEMAHGYGYTDEGDCNFVGFLSCVHSEDLYIQYSGWLTYFRYLLRDVRKADKEKARYLFSQLDAAVKNDLTAIQQQSEKFPDLLPWWRDVVYENYLRTHGVKEGLLSYNKIVQQLFSWRKGNHFPQIPGN
jgi:hypothetical protein